MPAERSRNGLNFRGLSSPFLAPRQSSHIVPWALCAAMDQDPPMTVNRAAVLEARQRLLGRVLPTPCRESYRLSRSLGGTVRLKLENLQVTGSFKERGAANKLLRLSEDQKKIGVI